MSPHGVRRTQPPKFQGQEYSEGSTAPPHTTSYYSTSTGTIYWKAVSSNPTSQPAPLHYRSSNTRHLHWEATTSRWPSHRSKAKEDITWCIQWMPDWNGRKMLDPPLQIVIKTNVSLRGWGAYPCVTFSGGCWSQEDPHHVRQYNSGVLSESHGGTKSKTLIYTARQVGEWCLQPRICLG